MQDVHDYGIDWDEPISTDNNSNTVTVPSLPSYVLAKQENDILRDKLIHHHDDTYGVEHYVVMRHFITDCQSP